MTQAVDFQILLPRAQDISRIQHIQQTNEQNQQQCFAAHLAHDTEIAQRTVQNPSQTREARIKEEERKQQQSLQHQQEKPFEKKKNASFETSDETIEKTDNANLGRHIDLKI
ncbi:MAG TPA: hypothetical protein GXX19_04320 [Syntrophomonadaceae bacterium]|nr:hypothetical protein [Syntrophomonadaceae bacterium]